MSRKEIEAFFEGNGPIPQQEDYGSKKPTLADALQRNYELEEAYEQGFDRIQNSLEKMDEQLRFLAKHLPLFLEQNARKPRLAMEADGFTYTKTRERKEGAAKAVQAMDGESCSANRVDLNPMGSTGFGTDRAKPPAPPCSGEIVPVDNGALTPKSCLLSTEMRTSTDAGGFRPTGETSTATMTGFDKLLYNLKFFLLSVPSRRRVIETKSEENSIFDPGGQQGPLRAS